MLIETVPHGRLFAKWNALFMSCVNTLACNPYLELLATFKASSSFLTVNTPRTGLKVLLPRLFLFEYSHQQLLSGLLKS